MYQLYTDGACKGNPGKGGWGYLVKRVDLPGFSYQSNGSEDFTTNNRMELLAVIQGLKSMPTGAKVEIFTDSTYVITVSKSTNPKIKNPDLVGELKNHLLRLDCMFTHVKGHSGHTENEYVDKLASDAAKNQGKIGWSDVAGVSRRKGRKPTIRRK